MAAPDWRHTSSKGWPCTTFTRASPICCRAWQKIRAVWFVPERLSQQEIAHRVGASRDMVDRVVKELLDGGYIAMEHKAITLLKKFPERW